MPRYGHSARPAVLDRKKKHVYLDDTRYLLMQFLLAEKSVLITPGMIINNLDLLCNLI